MLGNSVSLQQAILNAKHVLVLQHQYVPLSLALWNTPLVSLLKQSGKQVTVLVSEELAGWGQRVDVVYPTDMVLSLEQLRQVVSIPFIGEDAGVSDVTYDVVDENLKITVVPTGGELNVNALKIQEHGYHYDLILGIGVSALHPLIGMLSQYKPSLSGASAFMVGTPAQAAVFEERMPYLKSVEVVEKLSVVNLLEVISTVTKNLTVSGLENEVITLLAQQALRYAEGDVKTQSEVVNQVRNLTNAIDTNRMSKVYMSDFAKQNRVLQQILASAKKSNESSLVMYTLRAEQVASLNTTISDIIATTFYIPRFLPDEKRVVCISENEQSHHVFYEGDAEIAHKLAIRFGFAVADVNACGIVSDINADKLYEDIQRISGVAKFEPNVGTGIPVPQPANNMPSEISNDDMAPSEIEELGAEDLPVQQHEYSEEELDSGEVIDTVVPELDELRGNTTAPVDLPETQPVLQQQSQQAQQEILTSSGIDFAAIAKKMRESIT